jgi:hypothetical protein
MELGQAHRAGFRGTKIYFASVGPGMRSARRFGRGLTRMKADYERKKILLGLKRDEETLL